MIRVECSKCGKRFKVADKYAGRVTPCSSCGERIQIPESDAAEPDVAPQQETIDLASSDHPGDLPPPPADLDNAAAGEGLEGASDLSALETSGQDEVPTASSDEPGDIPDVDFAAAKREEPTIDEGPKRRVPALAIAGIGGGALILTVIVVMWIMGTFSSKDEAAPAPSSLPQNTASTPEPAEPQPQTPATPAQVVMPVMDQPVSATEGATLGSNARVRISSARVAPVEIVERSTGKTEKSKDVVLTITVEVTNLSDSAILEYQSWAGQATGFSRNFGTIEDDRGRAYKRRIFGESAEPVGRVNKESVAPGQKLTDVLLFDRPETSIKSLILTLPGDNVGAIGEVSIAIPADMIEH